MPLPLFFGAGAALWAGFGSASTVAAITTAATGVVSAANNRKKIKASVEQINEAKERHNKNADSLRKAQEKTEQVIHSYEKEVAKIRNSFEYFSDLIEELQNRPEFKPYKSDNILLPELSISEMKQSSMNPIAIDVGVLIGSASPLGLLITFFISHSLSEKADEIWDEMRHCEKQITKINQYLAELRSCVQLYKKVLKQISSLYYPRLYALARILYNDNRKDWFLFTEEEKLMVENLVCLARLLHEMLKVSFLEEKDEYGLQKINKTDSVVMIHTANHFMQHFQQDNYQTPNIPSEDVKAKTYIKVNQIVESFPTVIFHVQGAYAGENETVIVYGTITVGIIQSGDKLFLHNASSSYKSVEIIGFKKYPDSLEMPSVGSPISLILKGVSKDLVSWGNKITNCEKNI